ncbi:ArsR/SmtB family transcription factor [Nonomuraea sp. NPDC049309]|uniref:ArsR/SmtB family transcription factor n=1 Tax=Nonomuraea sp. NPDC049309 TaxID=3364350 RepID=UPI0037168119
MRLLPQPAAENIQLTEVLRALSDPVRLEIAVRLAAAGQMSCTVAGDSLGIHKSTASHHFRTLREAGVISTERDGRQKVMSLRWDDLEARFPGLLPAILAAASLTTHLGGPAAPARGEPAVSR